jgi:poly(hydroxyalkanoate) depolymerase family esterase
LRNISDTIARLEALQASRARYGANHSGRDHLNTLSNFGPNPGALIAKYHLPDDLPENAPLVVVLHGCTQNAAAYDHHSGWSQLADKAGFSLLYPEQQRANNQNLCFNWFLPSDTRRGLGEAASIRRMIEAMIMTHNLDRRRIFVTGLSAGGAMAAAMLASYPDVFAGGAIIAGLPFGSATTVPEAFDRMRGHGGPSEQALQHALQDASDHPGPWPRISIWQGGADHTVAPGNATEIAAQWRGVHGLKKAPAEIATNGRLSKEVWHDRAGSVLLDINMIAGMGHGTPIGDGLGTPGPYMLDVGISSTREIARFWGIADAERPASQQSSGEVLVSAGPRLASPITHRHEECAKSPKPDDEGQEDVSSGGVKKIIEDALRAAGLMR